MLDFYVFMLISDKYIQVVLLRCSHWHDVGEIYAY